ncbi:hypothetical protein GUITHDRAFT_161121 [Guillardia theta CCMP2712]|uniref:Calcium-transporting ATPase n=2 Tax=Guillardia theta TaxID=55529 RepID=L1JX62_GUITC|nr:hypothetical protein GUITHDRAFT_161121 [Guillardia theta CCMP2712]EKX52947.1 hypothetical protein GUITHDRAFT_161121 [Guillardia theta CCMP2712]|mmetsp:Transcript_38472/g.121186  ORF Transcript_38472/g.121186 Transcript_38472/m.121186 type:complete len:1058 (+) Transcript_38472:128-3301(+)|eukprot:XP_005839927.1 hypothetical protein GUITHDRAFT_161121 [Guillardia theta CCMP2712]
MADFNINSEQLSKFMRICFENPLNSQVEEKVLPALEELGGHEGIVKKLRTDSVNGISSSEVDTRKSFFGSNYVEPDPPDSIFQIAWEALQDPCLIFLCFAACVSFFVGIVFNEGMEWLEGLAILSAVFVVVTVSAVNDYKKEQQFRALNAVKDDVKVTVIRRGEKEKISTHDIVVGDVVLLSTGDLVCADGLVFDKNDLGISEAMLTGETVIKRKGPFELGSSASSAAKVIPALFAGTFVQEGEGRMLVTAVGTHTYQGLMEEKMREEEEEKSVLQQKLDKMTELITKAGAIAGGMTVAILLLRFVIAFANKDCCKETFDHSIHHLEWLRFLVVGVTVFVVAVPEGLPLAVTITLAFSVSKMMEDNNLVRHLSACETMGSATTICSDKTGTLTTGKMTVVKLWSCGEADETIAASIQRIPAAVQKLLAEAIVVNTSFKSDVEWDPVSGNVMKYTGNDTECAMLCLSNKILVAQGFKSGNPYKDVRQTYPLDDPNRHAISFSSDRKRMSTLIIPQGSTSFRLYTKGASEIVLGLCKWVIDQNGSVVELTEAMKSQLTEEIGKFSDEGLRTLSVAYRDFDQSPNMDEEEKVENDLVLIGLLGLEDPVRPEVPEAIRVCKRAGIVVRMVTGDNPRTAAAIAKKCGILSDDDDSATIMTGSDFREKVLDEHDEIDMDEFDKIWVDLRVLARSSPLDKLTLVTGIQQSKASTPQVVAVTGDGTNDAPALKKADVGFAMGITGTQVAQNAADIIVLDDNFASIVQAVKWGRCVYDNICKFLQFQLTVNLTACAIAVAGASILTKSPLNVIQLLWVNMIMDSFASLALATEDPRPDLLNRKPYPRTQPLLSPYMLRSLLCHAIWQLIILCIFIFGVGDVCPDSHNLNYCGNSTIYHDNIGAVKSGRPAAFDSQYLPSAENCIPVNERPPGYCKQEVEEDSKPNQHNAMIFTVFVLMQLFNQINARKIHGEWNAFTGIFDNKFFLSVMGLEFAMQFLMVEIPGVNTAVGCTGMTFGQWVLCIFIGATELPMHLLIARVPLKWLPKRLTASYDSGAGDGIPLLAMK